MLSSSFIANCLFYRKIRFYLRILRALRGEWIRLRFNNRSDIAQCNTWSSLQVKLSGSIVPFYAPNAHMSANQQNLSVITPCPGIANETVLDYGCRPAFFYLPCCCNSRSCWAGDVPSIHRYTASETRQRSRQVKHGDAVSHPALMMEAALQPGGWYASDSIV